MKSENVSPLSAQTEAAENSIDIEAKTAQDMREIGQSIAKSVRSADIIVLSGSLGAGKTSFAQGFGKGLNISEPVVSPTFTIARELKGKFDDGTDVNLVHVDAYRLPGSDNNASLASDSRTAMSVIMDELESLGLDEQIESPSENTVVLLEWASVMASVLSDERLEITIDRTVRSSQTNDRREFAQLTSEGSRLLKIKPVGRNWSERMPQLCQSLAKWRI